MASRIDDLRDHISRLEREIETEARGTGSGWHYRIDAGRVLFDRNIRLAHARLKHSIPRFFRESSVANTLSAPIVFSLIVPIALLDAWITLYQAICFRAYGIPRARRADYIVIDRQHLAYLNAIEKLNCVYCGYANGVLAYVREVAGRTEQYWCPIRHAHRVRAPHPHYRQFVEYGDEQAYRRRLIPLRDALKDTPSTE